MTRRPPTPSTPPRVLTQALTSGIAYTSTGIS
jgi:hypothetical protein